ncbi:MAG: tetratricopeptide repeat protein [Vicinamibacterales bacterium]
MRLRPAVLGLLLAAVLSACAPKLVPAPVVTTPRYPEFIRPSVPVALAGTKAAVAHDRAWRFLQAGDLKMAEREAQLALQASAAFFPAHAAAGYVDLAKGEPKSALAAFDRALQGQDGYVPALVGRGRALQDLERDDEALAAFEAALALDPKLTDLRPRVEVLRFRGVERTIAAAREAGRAADAEAARRAYERAIAVAPESAFLYRELGIIEARAGDREAALGHFRRAVELDPFDAASFVQTGELLDAGGDLEGALAAFDKAIAIEPSERTRSRREAVAARLELSRLPQEYRAIDGAPQITRAQLAALIAIRLPSQLESLPASEPGVITDVRGTWAERWIMNVARAGVMEPYENHTFQPRAIVRRVDIAPIVGRLLLRLAPPQQARAWQSAQTPFSDLSPGHLAYEAASAAVASGVMSRTPDGAFRPSQPVSGAEAIAMVDHIVRLTGAPASAVRVR